MAVAAGFLGPIHRLGGVAQQLLAVCVVQREQRHADAGRQADTRSRALQWFTDPAQNLEYSLVAVGDILDIPQQQGEFVTADACQGVSCIQALLQALGHADQQLVADVVAEAVVDRLEHVQIQQADRQSPATALGQGGSLLQAVGEQGAVGQAGEGIEMRQLVDALLVMLELGDVGKQIDVVAEPAMLVMYRTDVAQCRVEGAILATVPEFALPVSAGPQVRPHLAIEACIVAPRGKQAGALAGDFLAAVAGDAFERRVDGQNPAIGAGHGDALAAVAKHAGGQPQLPAQVALAAAAQAGQQCQAGDQQQTGGKQPGRHGRARRVQPDDRACLGLRAVTEQQ